MASALTYVALWTGALLVVLLALPVGYLLTFAIAGRRAPDGDSGVGPGAKRPRRKRALLLFPAYREDGVIIDSVGKALAHEFDGGDFEVLVAADQLSRDTCRALTRAGARVVEMQFEESTKARSVNAALETIPEGLFDFTVILDADNVMAPGCLDELSRVLDSGFSVVQGRRIAKNRQTATAVLDEISERFNNHVFRAGHRALGLSAALIGSGMAIDTEVLRQSMRGIVRLSEDKELELRLLEAGERLAFAGKAVILDEKVSDTAVLRRQRARWLDGQFHYLVEGAPVAFRAAARWHLDPVDKWLQFALPPRGLLMILLPVALAATGMGGATPWMAAALTLNVLFGASIMLTFPTGSWGSMIRALPALPGAVFAMLLAVLDTRHADRTRTLTPHTASPIKP